MSFDSCDGVNNSKCPHIKTFKENDGLKTFELIHGYFVSCLGVGSKKRKAKECVCKDDSCTAKYKRVHACLYCAYFGCYETHIRQHSKERKHYLAIDVNAGHVYCFKCQDYKYDSELEEIANKHKIIAACRRPDVFQYEYVPKFKDVQLLEMFRPSTVVMDGLRGLINMGHTCYLNCIVQSLSHAPVFRDYFLSDEHKCSFQGMIQKTVTQTDNLSVCFSCEMSKIVQELYNGKKEPFVPHKLLYFMWLQKKSLASYEQHDAHEFLLELLNVLHAHCKVTIGQADHHPNCLMDKIFTGFTQADLTCLNCQAVITTVDSFKIISLALDYHSIPLTVKAVGKKKVQVMPTLTECLDRLTQIEDLSYTCGKCNTKQICNMQMKLRKLPIIIIFHLKRLSRGYNNQPIEFQEHLDLNPYMAHYKVPDASNQENISHRGFDKTLNNKFFLFAVVEHRGNSKGGHYTAYVRFQKKDWYLCDDHSITKTTFEEVSKAPAYLLFYHKENLEYDEKSLREGMRK